MMKIMEHIRLDKDDYEVCDICLCQDEGTQDPNAEYSVKVKFFKSTKFNVWLTLCEEHFRELRHNLKVIVR